MQADDLAAGKPITSQVPRNGIILVCSDCPVVLRCAYIARSTSRRLVNCNTVLTIVNDLILIVPCAVGVPAV